MLRHAVPVAFWHPQGWCCGVRRQRNALKLVAPSSLGVLGVIAGIDLSKIDLSLDKNSIEIADVKKSFNSEEIISDSEAKSKLDLAKAYIEMNNFSSANEVINELINGASATYRKLALELSKQIKK